MRWASTNVEALTSSLDIVQRKKMGLGTDEERSDLHQREGRRKKQYTMDLLGGKITCPNISQVLF